jgi:hypothetical protein
MMIRRVLFIFALLVFFLFPRSASAESVPKSSIVELFSSTNCVYCPAAENALSKSYDSSGSKFIYVVYHLNDELVGSGVSKRVSYYGIFGTPTAEVDGTYRFLGPTDIGTKAIDRATLNSNSVSQVSIDFSGISFDQTAINFNVKVAGSIGDSVSIFAMLVEDNVKTESDSNKVYRFVVRSIQNLDGATLPSSHVFKFNNSMSYIPDNLFLVAFVQNMKTMEIYQSKEIKLVQKPVVPAILNSEQNIESLPLKIYLSGNSSGNFEVQVSTDSSFKNVLMDKSFSGNVFEIGKGDLSNGIYYSRAREIVGNDNSTWSGTFKFVIGASKNIVLEIDDPFMYIDGKKIEIDPGRGTVPLIIKDWGRTVLPIRAVVEALGGTVQWDSVNRKVTIILNKITIELWIDNPVAAIDGAKNWIDNDNHEVKPLIVNSRTMIPLRFVATSLGCAVDWNGTTQTITLTYQD